jgi:hypothetical protein
MVSVSQPLQEVYVNKTDWDEERRTNDDGFAGSMSIASSQVVGVGSLASYGLPSDRSAHWQLHWPDGRIYPVCGTNTWLKKSQIDIQNTVLTSQTINLIK